MRRHRTHLVFVTLSCVLAGCGSPSPGTFRGEPIDVPLLVKNQDWDDITPGQLWNAVRDQVVVMEIERRGLTVSDAEVDRVLEIKAADMESILPGSTRYIEHQDDFEQALRAWHAAPDKSEEIYQEMLAPEGISPEHWDSIKNAYPDADWMEQYWKRWDPDEARKMRRENTRNELLRIELAGAIQGTPVVVPAEKVEEGEAMRKDFTKDTGLEMPAGSIERQFKADEAASIIRDWFDDMVRSGELKLSDTYAKRIKIWMPGMPVNAW